VVQLHPGPPLTGAEAPRIFDNRISTGNYKLVAKRTDPLCVRSKFYGQATKGVRVDALAQAGDEGRGKLR
jgi:hypothetical protein